jgi:hypothetical protein
LTLEEFAAAVEEATLEESSHRAREVGKESQFQRQNPTPGDLVRQDNAFSLISFNECASSAAWLSQRKQFWHEKRQRRNGEFAALAAPAAFFPSVEPASKQKVSHMHLYHTFEFLCASNHAVILPALRVLSTRTP